MTTLIGFSGRSGAGKDTAAKALEPMGYKRDAFADPLKQMVAILAGEPVENFHDPVLKEQVCPALGVTRRRALQMVGNAMRNLFQENVWARSLVARWRAAGCPKTVVTDVRYDDEAQSLIDQGGKIVLLQRPDGSRLTGEAATDISEQGITPHLADAMIVNGEDLRTFEILVRQSVELLEQEG